MVEHIKAIIVLVNLWFEAQERKEQQAQFKRDIADLNAQLVRNK